MIRFDGLDAIKEWEKAFDGMVPNEAQLKWIYKFGRHCAGRCRNTQANANYLNRIFPHAEFRIIPKTDPISKKSYKGIDIRIKSDANSD